MSPQILGKEFDDKSVVTTFVNCRVVDIIKNTSNNIRRKKSCFAILKSLHSGKE